MELTAPKTLRENMGFRKELVTRCLTDPALRERVREKCRADLAFWVDAFVWQFNPLKKGGLQVGPFLLWDFQGQALKELRRAIADDKDILIEKSREMGASWLILILFLWLYLFAEDQALICLSRNEKAVDDENPNSLFWKLDFMLRRLPDWMKPRGLVRKKLFFGNPQANNTIAGESTTAKSTVGGRATAMMIDEFTQIDDDFAILYRTSDTSYCRIFNFTHLGLSTAGYHLTQRPDMRKLRMHWSQHPAKRRGLYRFDRRQGRVAILDKTYPFPPDYPFVTDGTPVGGPEPGLRSPWYDEQCRRKGDSRAVAMDLDINPEGTSVQFFDPVMIEGLRQTYACDPVWRGGLHYDALDPGSKAHLVAEPGGRLAMWLAPGGKGYPPPGEYGIGADVAAGTGATPSCASVVNRRTGEKVAEYTDPFIDAKDFGTFLVFLARVFSDKSGEPATLIWEIPGPGLSAGKQILSLGFRKVYWKRSEFTLAKKQSDQPGWYNHGDTQDALLREYRDALYQHRFVNHSLPALKETLKFAYVGEHVKHAGEDSPEDPSGARTNHGDHVIADALANKLCSAKLRSAEEAKEEVPANHPGTLAGRRLLAQNKDRTRLY